MTVLILLSGMFAVNSNAESGPNDADVDEIIVQSDGGYQKYISDNSGILEVNPNTVIVADGFIALDDTVGVEGYKAKWNEASGRISANVDVNETGFYNIGISYKHFGESSADIKIDFAIDGKLPFEECEGISLNRLWINETDKPQLDDEGNEFAPEQIFV